MKPSAALFLLFLLFLGLKLAGEITWPWVWICAPLWLPASLGLLFGFVIGFKSTFLQALTRARATKGTPAQVGGNDPQGTQPGQDTAQSGEAVLQHGQRNLAKAPSGRPEKRAAVSPLPSSGTNNPGRGRRPH